jgi:phosphoribosylaminoimidazole-succinocarboxamide synthase
MTTYSHTYNRGRELTEAEIYQAGVEREEKLAKLKKAVINFYRDEITGEILTICAQCFKAEDLQDFHGSLTYIDKAGSWDECRYCDAQNVPASYHGEI